MLRLAASIGLCWLCPLSVLAAGAIRIVAAENVYGDIAAQLAGPEARISSVLSNPDADPHMFEVNVSTARAVADADLVIYNGLSYDPWMARLLSSARSSRRLVVEASSVAHRDALGSNPHLWYDLDAMRAVARAITTRLQQIDPARKALYAQRLQRFEDSLGQVASEIDRMRRRYAGLPVAATEPLADYLVAALGLTMHGRRFQMAVMNATEPSASDTAAFEDALRRRSVRVLIYNRQVTSGAVQRLLRIAEASRVPIVAMTETKPAGADYQQWMLGQLRALDRALAGARP